MGVYVRYISWEIRSQTIIEVGELYAKSDVTLKKALGWLGTYPLANLIQVWSESGNRSAVVKLAIPSSNCPLYRVFSSYSSRNSVPIEEKVDSEGKVHWIMELSSIRRAERVLERIKNETGVRGVRMQVSKGRPLSRANVFLLKFALEHGYFDIPRRVSARELSQKTGLPLSTLDTALRRAVRHVLSEAVK